MIHVFDENRQMTKDFKCPRKLLLDNMKYFESYLKETENNEEIDIWVHCDVNIFAWLMNYIKKE